jgi:ADP-heptose:LPS heptosyltransferase
MVCITPVFREIKKKHPQCRIAVLGAEPAAGILSGNPHIDEVVRYNPFSLCSFLRVWLKLFFNDFAYSLNFFPSSFPNVLPFWLGIPERICAKTEKQKISVSILSLFNNKTSLYKKGESAAAHHLGLLRFLGVENPDSQREFFSGPKSEKKAEEFVKKFELSPSVSFVGISPFCGKKFREWPEEKFIGLAGELQKKHNAFIFFVGSEEEKEKIEKIREKIFNPEKSANTAGIFKTGELAAFLKKLSVFIGVDTGPLYMADAVGTPVIDIIGPSDPATQSPQGRAIVLQSKNMARPCSYIMYPPDCSEEELEKSLEVSVEEVVKAYENLVS